jgi:hypothetical protein
VIGFLRLRKIFEWMLYLVKLLRRVKWNKVDFHKWVIGLLRLSCFCCRVTSPGCHWIAHFISHGKFSTFNGFFLVELDPFVFLLFCNLVFFQSEVQSYL